MTEKNLYNHPDEIKKIRRQLEEKIRKELPPEKIIALATLLDVTPPTKK